MKASNFFLLAVILLLTISSAYAETKLQILEPRMSWYPQKGSIQDMSVYVIPQGTYSEVHAYVTFNSNGSSWNDITDTLEVVMNFQLDPKAMISDSYLIYG